MSVTAIMETESGRTHEITLTATETHGLDRDDVVETACSRLARLMDFDAVSITETEEDAVHGHLVEFNDSEAFDFSTGADVTVHFDGLDQFAEFIEHNEFRNELEELLNLRY